MSASHQSFRADDGRAIDGSEPRVDWSEYLAAHRRSMQRAAQRCALFAQGRTCAPSPEEMRAEADDQEIMRIFVVRRLTTLR